MNALPAIGFCVDRTFPPPYAIEAAMRLEACGGETLWVIEDCFYTAGVSLAAAALARTERLTVGLGILPALARNPAVTAMEFATLAGLGPGRVLAGIGHGVQDWMGQMGARVASPVTALGEVLDAVRRLLRGESVSVQGRYVRLDAVRLDQPPDPVPPVLAGVRGPKSLAVAGRHCDGLVLAELTGPTAVRAALADAAPVGDFQVAVFTLLHVDPDRRAARQAVAPAICELVTDAAAGVRAAPFFDDLAALVQRDGVSGVAGMPDDWWTELAAVGTPDDVHAHLEALGAAGAVSVGLFPPPDVAVAREQLARVWADVLR